MLAQIFKYIFIITMILSITTLVIADVGSSTEVRTVARWLGKESLQAAELLYEVTDQEQWNQILSRSQR